MNGPVDPVARLSASSRRRYHNPYTSIEWPDVVDRSQWFTSPELISLYGTETWDGLADEQRRNLSFWEAVNFFSLNIHGERALMKGVASLLYTRDFWDTNEYLHHLLDEENKHSIWFGTFCRRYAGKVYPGRTLVFPRDYDEGEEAFLFFAMIFVFEEIVDRYNLTMGNDERLVEVARRINAQHHADEARHLQFGRHVVVQLWDQWAGRWPAATVERVRANIVGYLRATWSQYYNPTVYRDAGLADPRAMREEAWSHPACREHRRVQSTRCLDFFVGSGILEEEPVL